VIEDEYFRLPGKLGEATQVLASLLLAFHARHALVLPATKYSHPESFKLTPNFLFRHRKKKKTQVPWDAKVSRSVEFWFCRYDAHLILVLGYFGVNVLNESHFNFTGAKRSALCVGGATS